MCPTSQMKYIRWAKVRILACGCFNEKETKPKINKPRTTGLDKVTSYSIRLCTLPHY